MKTQTIVTLDGTYFLDADGSYQHEPFEPDPETRHPGAIIIGLCIAAWAIAGGAVYCLAQAWVALT